MKCNLIKKEERFLMAESKKSFIAYSDWHGTFKALPDEVAGRLIKHIFSYVNDENPTNDDYLINALFEQIKSTLKRDLLKWESQKIQRSEAGKKSAELRATKSNERSITLNEKERNPTVNVNVNVNDNKYKDNNIDSRKLAFAHTLSEFIPEFDRELVKDFYDYWTETNEGGLKFRREMQKTWNTKMRLSKWKKNDQKFISNGKSKFTTSPEFNELTTSLRIANPRI